MAGTVITDLTAIGLTGTARAASQLKGADLGALVSQGIRLASELKVVLTQIKAIHPSGGGDAANFAQLGTIINELA